MTDKGQALKEEVAKLFNFIERMRDELASLRRSGDDDDQLQSMSEELDQIVRSTEQATETILSEAEAIGEAAEAIGESLGDEAARARLQRIEEGVGNIFEACSFQDLTGQRVGKIVGSLKYVDERVGAMVGLWGEEDLSRHGVRKRIEKTGDETLLHGPQREGEGASQDDIDKLFD